jgi:hypothetical protein
MQFVHTIAPDQLSFTDSATHIQALCAWLQQLLRWQIALTRETYGALADDEYRGLYIPDAEADLLSDAPAAISPALADEREALTAQRQAIAVRAAAIERAGGDLAMQRLARVFDLGQFEQDVLLVALAPELDLRYERLYAYIQDDVTKKRPAVDLVLRLLAPARAEPAAPWRAFAPDAPLISNRLIRLFEDGQRHAPLLARLIKLDDRVVAELRGEPRPAIDAALAPFVSLVQPARPFDTLLLPAALAERLRHSAAQPNSLVIALQGGYGSGRRAIAEALCAERRLPLPLLVVRLDQLLEQDWHDPTLPGPYQIEIARRIVREAVLRGAAIVWQSADHLLSDEATGAWRSALLPAIDEYRGLQFLLIEQPWEANGTLARSRYLRVELPALSYGEREQLWRRRLNGAGADDALLQALSSTFRLSGGQIRDAAAMAHALASWHANDHSTITRQDLYAACRAQSSGRLNSLAHKIVAHYGWGDLVLPPDQIAQLREISAQVRHRRTVLERWGFDKRLSMGKGVNVLFAGPSGTGKTMAAEIIAVDLGLELYKIDLSSMVSKYIGETEKNLDRVFSAAREANAILFFDEADAIFGKRSEVKDAHDRYANIEVGYLLQKMEEYDGVVILATNLLKNLDDAFVRRLHMTIDFPFPEEADRRLIWERVFPAEAPLTEDVNLAFLARQFRLTGGNIRNVALLAAFLAAEDDAPIGMPQLMRALRREYQKIGKLVTEAEFGKWLSVTRK